MKIGKIPPDFWKKYKYPEGKKLYTLNAKSLQKFYERLSRSVGIKINSHKFRRTYATILALKGINPAIAKELLGHSDVKTTLRYYTKVEKMLFDESVINLIRVWEG